MRRSVSSCALQETGGGLLQGPRVRALNGVSGYAEPRYARSLAVDSVQNYYGGGSAMTILHAGMCLQLWGQQGQGRVLWSTSLRIVSTAPPSSAAAWRSTERACKKQACGPLSSALLMSHWRTSLWSRHLYTQVRRCLHAYSWHYGRGGKPMIQSGLCCAQRSCKCQTPARESWNRRCGRSANGWGCSMTSPSRQVRAPSSRIDSIDSGG